jgi:hypothetical protein
MLAKAALKKKKRPVELRPVFRKLREDDLPNGSFSCFLWL